MREPSYMVRVQHAVCESSLPAHLRHLVMVMALLANQRNGVGWSSQRTIARAIGCDERSVRRRLRELAQFPDAPVQVSTRARYSGIGTRTSDEWTLVLTTGHQRPVVDTAESSEVPDTTAPSDSLPDTSVRQSDKVGYTPDASVRKSPPKTPQNRDTHRTPEVALPDASVRGSTIDRSDPAKDRRQDAKDPSRSARGPSSSGRMGFDAFAGRVHAGSLEAFAQIDATVLHQALRELGDKRGEALWTEAAWSRSLTGYVNTLERGAAPHGNNGSATKQAPANGSRNQRLAGVHQAPEASGPQGAEGSHPQGGRSARFFSS